MRASLLSAIALVFVAGGCGDKPPAAPVRPPPKPTASAVPAPPPPDLSAVPAPASLVATVRVAKPGESLAKAAGWGVMPRVTPAMLLEPVGLEGDLLDVTQPIDYAAGLPETLLSMRLNQAASAALRDIGAAKFALEKHFQLVPIEGGALRIERRSHGDGEPEEDRTCALSPAAGASPWRLVCANSPAAYTALAPYLVRTASRAPITSDIHAELIPGPGKPLARQYKPLLALGAGTFLNLPVTNQAVRALVVTLVTDVADFLLDVDRIVVDGAVAESGLELTMKANLATTSATLSKLAVAHPERTGSPPDAFWRLPQNADFAYFHRGIDDASGIQRALGDLVRTQLQSDRVTEPDRAAIGAAVEKLFSGAPAVYASGVDPALGIASAPVAARPPAHRAPPGAAPEPFLRVAEGIVGWRVAGVEAPFAGYRAAAEELVRAWRKPSVASSLQDEYRKAPKPAVRLVPADPKLPAKSFVLEIDTYPPAPVAPEVGKPTAPPKPLTLYVVFAPEDAKGGAPARTWIALAANKARAQGAITATAAPHAPLAGLRDTKAGAGGFVTVVTASSSIHVMQVLFGGNAYGLANLYRAIEASPNHGRTPIPFTLSAGPDQAVVATVQFPRAALQDMGALGRMHAFTEPASHGDP